MDESYVPIKIKHLVYVNTIKLRLASTMPSLTLGEMMQLRRQGPYTEDFSDIFPPLNPTTVQVCCVSAVYAFITAV